MNDAALTAEYLGYVADLRGDEAGRRQAWHVMGQGSAWYHGLPVAFSYVPRLFSAATRQEFRETAETTYGILTKVMREYAENPQFRREFRLDPRVERLALLPTPYAEPLPICRVDFMMDEDTRDFTFCEFNTDTSSGMNENREALRAVESSKPYACFAAAHQVENDVDQHFQGWVDTFLRIYRSVPGAVDAPSVAIVACLDDPNPDELGELEAYRQLFVAAGCACSVFDVRQLRYEGGKLVGGQALAGPGEVTIDCVMRYCIVVDLLENWQAVQPFVRAVEEGAVVLIGGFSTQIVHDKQLFAVLRGAAAQALLSPDESAFVAAHIPETHFLDDPDVDLSAVRAQRQQWVLKPTDWYASKNVTVGRERTQQEWEQLLDNCLAREGGSPFILQRFTAPYKTFAIPLYGDEADFTAEPQLFGNVTGLYLHAGNFAGAYVRQGPFDVIGSAKRGLVTPVLWVD